MAVKVESIRDDRGNLVYLGGVTKLDIPVSRVLNAASEEDLDTVILMGYTKDGEEYFACSVADGGTCLWMIEKFKAQLLKD